jgi:hypothetical protein
LAKVTEYTEQITEAIQNNTMVMERQKKFKSAVESCIALSGWAMASSNEGRMLTQQALAMKLQARRSSCEIWQPSCRKTIKKEGDDENKGTKRKGLVSGGGNKKAKAGPPKQTQ